METNSILTATNLTMQFGGIRAVSELNFSVRRGSITALIGPNGAGKTTVFNMVTGVYQPTSGQINFNGHEIGGLKPHQVTRKGLARTFQNIRLFKSLSVLDNVCIGMDINNDVTIAHSLFQLPKNLREERITKQKAFEMLKIFGLEGSANELSGSLPYGAQRRLEITRALATGAKLLLLDEPAAGMQETETLDLMNTLKSIQRDFDLSVLVIEHDMKLVMGVSEHIVVLDYGQKIAEGSPSHIQKDSKVIEAYLGKAPEASA